MRSIEKEVVVNGALFALGILIVGFILGSSDSSITGQSVNDVLPMVSIDVDGSGSVGLQEGVLSGAIKNAKDAAKIVPWRYVALGVGALVVLVFVVCAVSRYRKNDDFDVKLKSMREDLRKLEQVMKRK